MSRHQPWQPWTSPQYRMVLVADPQPRDPGTSGGRPNRPRPANPVQPRDDGQSRCLILERTSYEGYHLKKAPTMAGVTWSRAVERDIGKSYEDMSKRRVQLVAASGFMTECASSLVGKVVMQASTAMLLSITTRYANQHGLYRHPDWNPVQFEIPWIPMLENLMPGWLVHPTPELFAGAFVLATVLMRYLAYINRADPHQWWICSLGTVATVIVTSATKQSLLAGVLVFSPWTMLGSLLLSDIFHRTTQKLATGREQDPQSRDPGMANSKC